LAETRTVGEEIEASRFFVRSDPQTRRLVVDLHPLWWSRFYEYEWARNFAGPEDVALDAACGVSHPFKFHLADVCREVHACDVDRRILSQEAMLAEIAQDLGPEAATALSRSHLRRVRFARASITDLPYPDATFSRIFCISVLEHLAPQDLRQTLREFHRTLGRGGLLVVTTDVPSVDPRVLAGLAAETGFEAAGPVRFDLPADALYSDAYRLHCFRFLLRRP
jgi:ubiquinone/menaquinone biosynthesis C-methylase UbiE